MANTIIQEATSATTGLTYIAVYSLNDKQAVEKCEITVKQNKDETVFYSARTPDDKITIFRPIPIVDNVSANPMRLSFFLKSKKGGYEDRLVKNLLVTTKSMLSGSKGKDLK